MDISEHACVTISKNGMMNLRPKHFLRLVDETHNGSTESSLKGLSDHLGLIK